MNPTYQKTRGKTDMDLFWNVVILCIAGAWVNGWLNEWWDHYRQGCTHYQTWKNSGEEKIGDRVFFIGLTIISLIGVAFNLTT